MPALIVTLSRDIDIILHDGDGECSLCIQSAKEHLRRDNIASLNSIVQCSGPPICLHLDEVRPTSVRENLYNGDTWLSSVMV